jgi:hypothetical protein
MSFLEGLQRLFQSRKFWVLIIALVTAVGSYLGGLIDGLAMVQLVIAALAVYSTGIAIVDSGVAIQRAEELKKMEDPPKGGAKRDGL